MPSHRTIAFDVEGIRKQLLARVKPPDEIVNRMFTKISEKLDAKKTEFFAYQGKVVETVDVEDHATQQRAVDQIIKISGLGAGEKEQKQARLRVTMRIDPITGVFSLVYEDEVPLEEGGHHAALEAGNAPTNIENTVAIGDSGTGTEPEAQSLSKLSECDAEPQVQIVKVRQGGLPVDVYRALFGEADE